MSQKLSTQSLEKWLQTQVQRQDAEALKPLPSTRALGERFGVSHGTVFRLLSRMEGDGHVWRHANGRFYPALAGKVLGRGKPLAVILRRMQTWSSLCREVLEGFTDECSDRDRPILWFHNRHLVKQESAESGVVLASIRAQKTMLQEFRLHHGDSVGGILLDEVWKDEAIRGVFPPEIPLASFSRLSSIPNIGAVVADFKAGALLAISHLLANGFDKIYLIDPLPGYEPSANFISEARTVFHEIAGRDLPQTHVTELHTASQRTELVRMLSLTKSRVGLICPEDNVALALAGQLRESGLLGVRHGLVSVMGTSILPSKDITCVKYDFREMGRQAAEMLDMGAVGIRRLPPTLEVGKSTVGN